MDLSKSDRKILSHLQRDSTLSSRDLAEKLAMSQSTLWRRINDFERAGIIRGRVALLDAEALGVSVCVFVSINLKSHDTEARQAFQNFVFKFPEIVECFAVTGTHDYTLIVRTDSVANYERFLMNQILAHPSVASAASQIALSQLKYSTELPLPIDASTGD